MHATGIELTRAVPPHANRPIAGMVWDIFADVIRPGCGSRNPRLRALDVGVGAHMSRPGGPWSIRVAKVRAWSSMLRESGCGFCADAFGVTGEGVTLIGETPPKDTAPGAARGDRADVGEPSVSAGAENITEEDRTATAFGDISPNDAFLAIVGDCAAVGDFNAEARLTRLSPAFGVHSVMAAGEGGARRASPGMAGLVAAVRSLSSIFCGEMSCSSVGSAPSSAVPKAGGKKGFAETLKRKASCVALGMPGVGSNVTAPALNLKGSTTAPSPHGDGRVAAWPPAMPSDAKTLREGGTPCAFTAIGWVDPRCCVRPAAGGIATGTGPGIMPPAWATCVA